MGKLFQLGVSLKINQSDYNKLQKKLKELKAFDKRILATEIAKTGAEISRIAKRSAPKDTGALQQSISFGARGKQVVVVADKMYAPYVEFGTGGKYNGADLIELFGDDKYAAQFMGKSQDRIHLPARPFFFSSARIGFKNLYDRVNNRLKNIINR